MRPAVPKTLNVCEKIQTTTMTIRCLLLKWFLPSLLCSIVSFAIILISLEGAFMLFWDFWFALRNYGRIQCRLWKVTVPAYGR